MYRILFLALCTSIGACTFPDLTPADTSSKPAATVAAGSARVRGARYTVDVQIGQPAPQAPVSGGGKTVRAVTPLEP
jgi:hypothetical protein